MKTLYAACLSRLGLSQSEAASLHGVRLDTVKSWASGRREPADGWAGVFDDLRAYEAQIAERADAMLEAWDRAGSPPIELEVSGADAAMIMAAADFVLSSHGPVHVGQTAATLEARQARRPN